jgi:hypothetical protein
VEIRDIIIPERVDLEALCADEGARALLGLEHPLDLELAVGANHGVGIDGQVDGQLADVLLCLARVKRLGSVGARV